MLMRETALSDVKVPLLLLIVPSTVGRARAMATRSQAMKVKTFIVLDDNKVDK